MKNQKQKTIRKGIIFLILIVCLVAIIYVADGYTCVSQGNGTWVVQAN